MKNTITIIFCTLFSLIGNAQTRNDQYLKADEYVAKLGALNNVNVAIIADTITNIFPEKEMKARAIYSWIANNIALDPKAIKSNDNKKSEPEVVIQSRKATALGFAMLVQEMCSQANIRCLTVDGNYKFNIDDINNSPDAINYSWNVLQLGTSPNEWFYIDAARASGFLDKKQTTFTKQFSTNYFFAEKAVFNLQHYPDNIAWMLGEGPRSLKDFYSLPLIGDGAYNYKLIKPSPANGFITTKPTVSNRFSFKINPIENLSNISIVIGEGSKQLKPERINYTSTGNEISFNYKFKNEDSYPFKIIIDGQDVLTYYVESSE